MIFVPISNVFQVYIFIIFCIDKYYFLKNFSLNDQFQPVLSLLSVRPELFAESGQTQGDTTMNALKPTKQSVLKSAACLLALAGSHAIAAPFDCNTSSDETCTITIAPGGGAGVELSAPGRQFSASIDGSGFEVHGNVNLLGGPALYF